MTGFAPLDLAMEIPVGEITTIFGESGTGKTTFILQMAALGAASGLKPLIAYCDGPFPSERLLQILVSRGMPRNVLDSLVIIEVKSFEDQERVVDVLDDLVDGGGRAVFFDSITGLYRAELQNGELNNVKLNKSLNRQLATLLCAAKKRGIAIVVTSQVRASMNGGIEPVAYKILNYWSKVMIRMEKMPSGVRRMVFIKPERQQSLIFTLSELGIT